MDGVILFDNLDYFAQIKNIIYQDVMSNFKPKIKKYANKVGVPFFNKFCFFVFRTKYEDDKNKALGKIYTLITVCLHKDTTDAMLSKFSGDFKTNFSEFLFAEKNLPKVQNYRLKQNIQIQYYDPMAKIDPNNPEIPNFYTSFNREGLVLNNDPKWDPLKTKFSFRFDQVVDCLPNEAATLKAILPEKLASMYKPDDCCITYLVDWQMKGVKNMFCSMYDKMFRCKTDIKIFQSTLYEYCIAIKVDNLNLLLKKHNGDLTKAKLYFLEQASLINMLKEVIDKDIEKHQNPESKFYKDLVELKKKAKSLRKTALKLFEKDINQPDDSPTCKDILNGALQRDAKKEDDGSDFEKKDRAQEKAEKTNAAQALKKINQYKLQYCQELKDMKINDDKKDKDKKKDKPKDDNKNKDKPKDDNKKPNDVKDKLNDIKKMALDTVNHCKQKESFTPAEALKLTNVILKNHKVFEKAHKKKTNIPKKICNELKTNPPQGVNSLEKLVNEKKMKFDKDKPVSPPLPKKNEGDDPLKAKDDENQKKEDIKVK